MADKASSTSSQAPSLLSSATAAGAGTAASGTRILANLEGRGAPPAAAPSRSRGRSPSLAWALLLAGLVLAAGVMWGQSQRAQYTEPARAPERLVEGTAWMPSAPVAAEGDAVDSRAAVIVDDEAARAVGADANPLAALTLPGPASGPQVPAQDAAARLQALMESDTARPVPPAGRPGPARSGAGAARSTPPRADTESRAERDPDEALLSALLALQAMPDPARPAATLAMRSLPGLDLAERLDACRELGFLRGEQCRLQVCAGQWGLTPECPTAQAAVTP